MFDVAQLPGTSDDSAVSSVFTAHRATQLFTAALIVLIALWGSCLDLIRVFFLSPFPLVLSSCQNLKVKSTKDCKDQAAKNSLESEY